jgi:hypothetical protein
MRNPVLALLWLLSLAGCFNPNLDSYMYLCSVANPCCPDGYTCVDGLCRRTDAGITTPAPSGVALGCASGQGYPVGADTLNLGTRVWACAGTFSPSGPPASSLCSATYKPCDSGLQVAVDANLCQFPPGCPIPMAFFVANVAAHHARGMPVDPVTSCGAATVPGDVNLWMGCGTPGHDYVLQVGSGCQRLGQAIDCGAPDSSLQCSTESTLDQITNTDPNNGVLCCSRLVQ